MCAIGHNLVEPLLIAKSAQVCIVMNHMLFDAEYYTRRLSRPSLAQQSPLPADIPTIKQQASLACPSEKVDSQFIFSPLVRNVLISILLL